MTSQGANRAVTISALTVFGIYFYRLITEGQSGKGQQGGVGQLIGIGTPANIGRFITGWGFAFLVIGVLAEAAPQLGGSFAIVVAVSDLFANVGQISADIGKQTTLTKQQQTAVAQQGKLAAGSVGVQAGQIATKIGAF
jgi:hypothetical protein